MKIKLPEALLYVLLSCVLQLKFEIRISVFFLLTHRLVSKHHCRGHIGEFLAAMVVC